MKTLFTLIFFFVCSIGRSQEISLQESIQYLESKGKTVTVLLSNKGWILEKINKDNLGGDIFIYSYGKSSTGQAQAFITKGIYCLEYQVPNDKVFQQQRIDTDKYSLKYVKEVVDDQDKMYTTYANELWVVKFMVELDPQYTAPSYNILVCKIKQ